MEFVSTRGGARVSAAEAILRSVAEDGGLYVPAELPVIGEAELAAMLGMDYPERAALLLGKFFEEWDAEALAGAIRAGCAQFEGDDPAPLVRMDDGMYLLELFHGPTCSEKDLGYAALPHLLQRSLELCSEQGKKLLVLAYGGDTGKAALERFCGREDAGVLVYYPEEGISKLQKLQICTQDGENVRVIAVRAGSDECSMGVRKLLTEGKYRTAAQEKGALLISGNSLNAALLLSQVCYFFSAYCDLVTSEQISMGDRVSFCMPAGNFATPLAAMYAQKMGLPVGKLVCASNKNSVFTDFVKTGNYDIKRPCFHTMSPAMDLLCASNIERLLFELSGRNGALTAERMGALAASGRVSIRVDEHKRLKGFFEAASASEDDTVDCIYEFFMEYGYPMDTHTGVAMDVAEEVVARQKDDPMSETYPMVVLAGDSPYKFPQDVLYALTGNDVKDSFKGVKRIHLETAMKVPEPIKAVRYKPIRFKTAVSPEKLGEELLKFIG